MGSSSSKQSNTMPTGSTVTTPQLPGYMQPYMADILSRGQELSYQPYTPYQDQRIAGFTPGQVAAQQGVLGMQPAGQFNTATQFATQAGLAGLGAYQPAPTVQAPQLSQYTMGPAQQVSSRMVRAPQMNAAQTGFAPDLQSFQMGPAQQVSSTMVNAPQMNAAQTAFAPDLQAFQMSGPEGVSAERASTGTFTQPGVASQYMSPYMQNVVNVQKEAAIEDAKKAQLGQNLAAARQGTYGGARQTLAQGERESNLNYLLNDIQAKGSQAAYDAAQRQFEAEQGRGLQAQQTNIQSQLQAQLANQQAGLTAGQQNLAARLGVQELGTRTGLDAALANLSAQQQANVQNQATSLQAQGMNQDQALRAALANQQAGLTTGQQNLAAQLGVQELGTRTGLDAALANLSSQQQANVQNQAASLQAQGMNQEQALRAALANQQAGLTIGQQNLGALLGVQELGAQQGMQASLANQQAALEARRLGLTGAGMGLEAAQTLSGLGSAQQNAELQRLGAISGAGAEQQALQQQQLDMAYQDFLRQQQYPMQQLQQYAGLIGGLPTPGPSTVTSSYSQPSSLAGQLLGAAGSLGSAYMMSPYARGEAKGGEIKQYNGGGLVAFADGGSAEPQAGLGAMPFQPMGAPQNTETPSAEGLSKQAYDLIVNTRGNIDQINGIPGVPSTVKVIAANMLREKMNAPQMPNSTVAQQLLNPQPQPSGLGSVPVPDNMFTAAEGGVVGYQSAGEVYVPPATRSRLTERLKKLTNDYGSSGEGAYFNSLLKKYENDEIKSGDVEAALQKYFTTGESPLLALVPTLKGPFDYITNRSVTPKEWQEINRKKNPLPNVVQEKGISKGQIPTSDARLRGEELNMELSTPVEQQGLVADSYLSRSPAVNAPGLPAPSMAAPSMTFNPQTVDIPSERSAADIYKEMEALAPYDTSARQKLVEATGKTPTDKEDFLRTIGEYFTELTNRASQPGAGVLSSALGATSVLPTSTAEALGKRREAELRQAQIAADVEAQDNARKAELRQAALLAQGKEKEAATEAKRFNVQALNDARKTEMEQAGSNYREALQQSAADRRFEISQGADLAAADLAFAREKELSELRYTKELEKIQLAANIEKDYNLAKNTADFVAEQLSTGGAYAAKFTEILNDDDLSEDKRTEYLDSLVAQIRKQASSIYGGGITLPRGVTSITPKSK